MFLFRKVYVNILFQWMCPVKEKKKKLKASTTTINNDYLSLPLFFSSEAICSNGAQINFIFIKVNEHKIDHYRLLNFNDFMCLYRTYRWTLKCEWVNDGDIWACNRYLAKSINSHWKLKINLQSNIFGMF